MVNIEKISAVFEKKTVRYGSLKAGEGFTHTDGDYLCIKTPDGHMYNSSSGIVEGGFNRGELDSDRKVLPVDVGYSWSRPE